MASRDFRIGTEVAFLGRNTINSTPILFVVLRPFSIFKQSQKEKGGNHLENLIVIKNGDIDFEDLTKEQQQEFMTFLFKCFSKMYEEKAKGAK